MIGTAEECVAEAAGARGARRSTQFNIYSMQEDPGPGGIIEDFARDVMPAFRDDEEVHAA